MLETLNSEIVEFTPEDQLEDEIGRLMSILRRYKELCYKALKPPPPVDKPPGDPLPQDTHADAPHSPDSPLHLPPDPDTSATGVAGSKVKLPKISLPCFKGNPIYWTTFWDSYEYTSMVPYLT